MNKSTAFLWPEEISTGAHYTPYQELDDRTESLWQELLRTSAMGLLPQASTTVTVYFVVEALPVALAAVGNAAQMITALERLFGGSATQTARMLRVSRPMVYHYREGMEPSIENQRRLQALAMLTSEWSSFEATEQFRKCLKMRQPEGRTLLEFLSDEELDLPALRRMLRRNVAAADKALREKLLANLTRGEDVEARSDIRRERQEQGRAVYVGDPDSPGKLIRISPDGSRVRGRMVKRKFVPDE